LEDFVMKRTIVVAALLTLSSAVFAQKPAEAPSQATPAPAAGALKSAAGPDLGEAAAGEVIYLRYCAACHGRSLAGDGPVASGLIKPPDDLTLLARKNGGEFPYDKVAATIDGRQTTRMHGTPDMPVWGEIFGVASGTDSPSSESAVKRITHYVWSRQAKPGSAPAKK
jgi:mono/diheme cytochrome c family protein